MTPSLPPRQLYLPFESGPYRMAMGLVTVPEHTWFVLDEHYREEMAERRRLLAVHHADVFATLPQSDAARRETPGQSHFRTGPASSPDRCHPSRRA